jgi:hypothetical protein
LVLVCGEISNTSQTTIRGDDPDQSVGREKAKSFLVEEWEGKIAGSAKSIHSAKARKQKSKPRSAALAYWHSRFRSDSEVKLHGEFSHGWD